MQNRMVRYVTIRGVRESFFKRLFEFRKRRISFKLKRLNENPFKSVRFLCLKGVRKFKAFKEKIDINAWV